MSVLTAIVLGLTVAVPVVAVVAGVFGPVAAKLVDAHVTAATAAKIRSVVDDVYMVFSAVAAATPGTLDDDYANVLKRVDEQFQAVHGRPLTAGEKAAAGAQILANHADPSLPSLNPPTSGNTLGATVNRALE